MIKRKWEENLVERLIELTNPTGRNRAALAHLRRGLGMTLDYTLTRVGWLFHNVPEFAVDHAVLAAGLFAWAKGACAQKEEVNFGTAFGSGLTLAGKQQRERRFIDLLETDSTELSCKLRQAFTLVAGGVGLDWALLIRHLRYWSHPERWVQQEWARGFWAFSERPAADQ